MEDRVLNEHGFISDPALGVLMCAKHAWCAAVSEATLVYIVPADDAGDYWHYARADSDAGTLDASEKPVARHGLASFAQPLGIHGDLDWQPERQIKPARKNPIVTMFEEGRV
jgi:hypothetical protein